MPRTKQTKAGDATETEETETEQAEASHGAEEPAAPENGVMPPAAAPIELPPAPPAAYEIQINNGNVPGDAIVSLDNLGAVARAHLIDGRERSVLLRVTAVMRQGENAAERVDGVK